MPIKSGRADNRIVRVRNRHRPARAGFAFSTPRAKIHSLSLRNNWKDCIVLEVRGKGLEARKQRTFQNQSVGNGRSLPAVVGAIERYLQRPEHHGGRRFSDILHCRHRFFVVGRKS